MAKAIIDSKRIKTMQERLGEKASNLIDSKNHLPMFRNRQIHYKKEFDQSIKVASKKKQPSRYFAKMWATCNLNKTLSAMRKLINRAATKLTDAREQARIHKEREKLQKEYNPEGRKKLYKLLEDSGRIIRV